MKNRILILPLALLGLGLAACSPKPGVSHSSIQDGTDSTQASSSQQPTSSSSSTGSQPSSDSSSSTEPDRLTFTIFFHSNGGTEISPQTVYEGDLATEPADPVLDGYTFDAWYEDKALTKAFDFTAPIHSDWHLYAGYIENNTYMIYTTQVMSCDVNGNIYEGVGVPPTIEAPFDEAAFARGVDTQLERAVEYIRTGR